jgi:hypothetical protein
MSGDGTWTVEQAAEHVIEAFGRAVDSIIAVGKALVEVKSRIPHGSWGALVDALPIGVRQCQRFMQVAATFGNASDTTYLPPSLMALAALAQLPGQVLGEVAAEGRIRCDMTEHDALALVALYRAGSLTAEQRAERDREMREHLAELRGKPGLTRTVHIGAHGPAVTRAREANLTARAVCQLEEDRHAGEVPVPRPLLVRVSAALGRHDVDGKALQILLAGET